MQGTRRRLFLSMFLIFCVFCGLSWLFPYTGDDWTWGSYIGIDRLKTFFRGYNGRYLGNLLELSVTRSKLLATVLKALSFTLACFLCWKYSGSRSLAALTVSFALFLMMPKTIFREAVAWTAGFSNYVPSALASVVYICKVSRISQADLEKRGNPVGLFLLGFAGALFIENIAIFNILLSAAVLAVAWFRYRKVLKEHLAFLAGAVVGAGIVFSNSAYQRVAAGTDTYRNISNTAEGMLNRILQNAADILDYLIVENILFCLVVSVMLSVLVLVQLKKMRLGKRIGTLAAACMNWGVLALVLFEHLCDNILGFVPGVLALPAYIVHTLRLYIGLAYVATVVVLIVLTVPKERQFRVLLPLVCVPVSMAPLLLVLPLGPRCVFAGYLLMMVCVVALFEYLWSDVIEKQRVRQVVLVLTAAAIAGCLVLYCSVYIPVFYWDGQRNAFAKHQSGQGSDTVYICELPYQDYLHYCEPVDFLLERYILVHGLREDVVLEFVSRQELAQMIGEEMH